MTVLLVLLLVSACGPAQRQAEQPATSGEAQPSGPKTLTVAIQGEPTSFDASLTGAAADRTLGGVTNLQYIVHDGLTSRTGAQSYEPRLALEAPTVEKGTWVVNPDGSMDMTWKLRPNIKWQDGSPFTADDMMFTFQVRRDPDLPRLPGGRGRPELMRGIVTPDPQTIVIHWSQVYVLAGQADGLEPLPRHLLGDLWSESKDSMTQSRYFTTDFVGLGAFKLSRWVQGSHMEFERFEDYYRGRAPIDRVILRFIPDGNTMVASILAEAVDVVLPTGVDLDAALDLRKRWEGTGNQVRFDVIGGLHQLEIQHRAEYARPVNGLTNRNVRQAFYQAIDRQTLADVMAQGFAPPADSWYAPNDAVRKDVEQFIPQFPYNPADAARMLEGEGWVRGADGVLTHQPSGERFQVQIQLRPGDEAQRAGAIIADGWKAVGALVDFDTLTPGVANDGQYLSTRPGPALISPSGYNFYDRRLHSMGIPRAETRWTGNNRGGYSNPRVDALLDKLAVTVGDRERIPLHADLLREQMGDIALMPLYWEVLPILMVRGVTGPYMQGSDATPNIFDWNKGVTP
jgi:peptide/nickel transport system substrate-binding protein